MGSAGRSRGLLSAKSHRVAARSSPASTDIGARSDHGEEA
ncbi:hypothetical protein PF003_g22749 [Phytophthora fragariae]|nr:hypothetical protein PF003_g22749 [Phytophthora fragariae]